MSHYGTDCTRTCIVSQCLLAKENFRSFVTMETNDEAKVSKIANNETINNNLDMSIYENAF